MGRSFSPKGIEAPVVSLHERIAIAVVDGDPKAVLQIPIDELPAMSNSNPTKITKKIPVRIIQFSKIFKHIMT